MPKPIQITRALASPFIAFLLHGGGVDPSTEVTTGNGQQGRGVGPSLIGFKTTEPPGTSILKPGVGKHGFEAFEDAGDTGLNSPCVGKRAVVALIAARAVAKEGGFFDEALGRALRLLKFGFVGVHCFALSFSLRFVWGDSRPKGQG